MNLLEGADQTPNADEILNKWKDKSQDELLKAKVEADLHIKRIERENAEMREMYLSQRDELLAKAKFEEYIDQIKNPQGNQVAQPKANEEADSHRFDPKELESLLDKKLSEYEKAKSETENFRKVQSKLQERYGDNFASVLKDQQSMLGLSTEEINGLAKKSPEAFFRMLGLNDTKKDSFQAPPKSYQRNDSFAPKGAPRRDYNYYQELKKTNPNLYLDPKISKQMESDALEMGEAFFD